MKARSNFLDLKMLILVLHFKEKKVKETLIDLDSLYIIQGKGVYESSRYESKNLAFMEYGKKDLYM